MAIPPTTHWDIRTSGSDTNGGGFVPGSGGTDYSQQDAAHSSGTLGTATGTTAFSDAGHSFTSTEVGNLLQIASGAGFTAGFYQVVSVSTGVATLDRSPGTGTVAVWSLGGGLQTLSTLVSYLVTNTINSNYVGIKSGTYTYTSSITLTGAMGGDTANGYGPTVFEGYGTTHGDGGTKPLITTATNSTPLFILNGVIGFIFRNISFTNTAGTKSHGICTPTTSAAYSENIRVESCYLSGFDYGVYTDDTVVYGIAGLTVFNCELTACTIAAVEASFGINLLFNRIHDNTGAGFLVGGVVTTDSFNIIGNNFYKNTYGWDIGSGQFPKGTSLVMLANTFSDMANYGCRFSSNDINDPLDFIFLNNIFYNNGSGDVDNPNSGNNQQFLSALAMFNAYSGSSVNWPAGLTLTGDPFVARASGNFELNNTAGAGAVCRAAGFPGVTGMGTGYIDIGTLQHQDSGGGGGSGIIVGAGMTGGIRG